MSGSVNNTHADNGTHFYNYDFEVSQHTLSDYAPLTCTIAAQTVNIGDGALPTTVSISVDNTPGITINSVRHVRGLYKDDYSQGNRRYNLSVPLSSNYGINSPKSEWVIEVKYSPKDARITNMKLEFSYNDDLWNVTGAQPFTEIGTENGTLQARINMTSMAGIQPQGTSLASMLVTLKGNLKGKTAILTSNTKPVEFPDSPKSNAFQPLFEIRDVSSLPETRRYNPREDNEGDGWGRPDILAWLTTGAGNARPQFNDISGQNGWQEWNPDQEAMMSMGDTRATSGSMWTPVLGWKTARSRPQ